VKPTRRSLYSGRMRCAVLSLLPMFLLVCGCSDDRGSGDAGGPGPGLDAGPVAATDGGGVPPGTDAGPHSTGGGAIGDRCTTDADCTDPPDAECFTRFENPFDGSVVAEFPNGFCSKGCESGDDCGTGGEVTCASGGSAGGGTTTMFMYCAPTCGDDSECRDDEGYRCATILGFGYCSP